MNKENNEYESIEDLALNLRSSWNHSTDDCK